MRRVLLYLLSLIFLAGSGCYQKRFGVVKTPLVPKSHYDRFAPVIIDVCDPAIQARRFAKEVSYQKKIRSYCAAGMKSLEEPLSSGEIQNKKLRGLIEQYRSMDFKKID